MPPCAAASKEDPEVPSVNHVTPLLVKLRHVKLSVVERRKLMQARAITDFVALVYLILKGVHSLVPFVPEVETEKKTVFSKYPPPAIQPHAYWLEMPLSTRIPTPG